MSRSAMADSITSTVTYPKTMMPLMSASESMYAATALRLGLPHIVFSARAHLVFQRLRFAWHSSPSLSVPTRMFYYFHRSLHLYWRLRIGKPASLLVCMVHGLALLGVHFANVLNIIRTGFVLHYSSTISALTSIEHNIRAIAQIYTQLFQHLRYWNLFSFKFLT